MALLKGQVDWFNEKKGFGFVSSPGLSGPALLHYSALNLKGLTTVRAGEEISFTVRQARNGPRVEEVFFDAELECLTEIRNFLDAIATHSELKMSHLFCEAIENAFYAQPYIQVASNELVNRFLDRFQLIARKQFIKDFILARLIELEEELLSHKVRAIESCDLMAIENPEKARSLKSSILSFNPERTKMEARRRFLEVSRKSVSSFLD